MATRNLPFPLFIAAGLLVVVHGASAEHYDRIEIAGAYEGRPAFDLSVRCSRYSSHRRSGATHFWGGDSPNFTPQYIVSDMALKLDQHRIVIPREAFADLGDVLVPSVGVDATLVTFTSIGAEVTPLAVIVSSSRSAIIGSYSARFSLF
jgi:hypothetical protein